MFENEQIIINSLEGRSMKESRTYQGINKWTEFSKAESDIDEVFAGRYDCI